MVRGFSICLFLCYSSFSFFLSFCLLVCFQGNGELEPRRRGRSCSWVHHPQETGRQSWKKKGEKACVPLHLCPSRIFVHFHFSLLFLSVCLSVWLCRWWRWVAGWQDLRGTMLNGGIPKLSYSRCFSPPVCSTSGCGSADNTLTNIHTYIRLTNLVRTHIHFLNEFWLNLSSCQTFVFVTQNQRARTSFYIQRAIIIPFNHTIYTPTVTGNRPDCNAATRHDDSCFSDWGNWLPWLSSRLFPPTNILLNAYFLGGCSESFWEM